MTPLNHTAEELTRIKNHLLASLSHDAGTLLSQWCNKENVFNFGIIREIMAYIEVCGAIYCGWDGINDKKVTTSKKAITFIKKKMGGIDPNYKKNGELFYGMYRHGSTHLSRPHRISIKKEGSEFLFTWKLYSNGRESMVKTDGGLLVKMKHLELVKTAEDKRELPVSAKCLLEDAQIAIGDLLDELIKIRKKKKKEGLPLKQRKALTFIAEGIVKRDNIQFSDTL